MKQLHPFISKSLKNILIFLNPLIHLISLDYIEKDLITNSKRMLIKMDVEGKETKKEI